MAALVGLLAAMPLLAEAADRAEPSVVHGAGQVVQGVIVELPKTVLDATMHGPVVVGPLVGLLAGAARALQVTTAGLVEMAAGFHPFEERRAP